jgi:hypothetical protein
MSDPTSIRCWYCAVEPIAVHDVTRLGSPVPEYLAQWPDGDHPHAERPPSPAELEQAGHEALSRVQRQGWTA